MFLVCHPGGELYSAEVVLYIRGCSSFCIKTQHVQQAEATRSPQVEPLMLKYFLILPFCIMTGNQCSPQVPSIENIVMANSGIELRCILMFHQYYCGSHFALLSIKKPFCRKDSTGKDRRNNLFQMLNLDNSFSDNSDGLQVFADDSIPRAKSSMDDLSHPRQRMAYRICSS